MLEKESPNSGEKQSSQNGTAKVAEPKAASTRTPRTPPLRPKANFLTQSTQRALASPSSRHIIPGITGLRNLGNTCFMNTVLQALSNTAEFRNFFVHLMAPDEEEGRSGNPPAVILNGKRYTRQPTLDLLDTIRKHVPKLEEVSLAMEVHSLLRVLWSGKWAVVTPFALLESVWKFVPKFRNRQQQDAQEFLCYLFDRLQLELQHANDALGNTTAPAPTSSHSLPTQKPTPPKLTGRKKRGNPEPALPPPTPPPLSSDKATIITETFQGKLLSEVSDFPIRPPPSPAPSKIIIFLFNSELPPFATV